MDSALGDDDAIRGRHQVGKGLRCVGERIMANSRPSGGEKSHAIIGSRNGIQEVEVYKLKIKFNVEVEGRNDLEQLLSSG